MTGARPGGALTWLGKQTVPLNRNTTSTSKATVRDRAKESGASVRNRAAPMCATVRNRARTAITTCLELTFLDHIFSKQIGGSFFFGTSIFGSSFFHTNWWINMVRSCTTCYYPLDHFS